MSRENYQDFLKRYKDGKPSHLTGNRLYNGISNSPHSGGGLDKSGYIDRDKKAKTKRDLLIKQLRSGGF